MVQLPTCYNIHSNVYAVALVSEACGVPNATNPYVPCCVKGDYCMSDGICHFTHPQSGATGYYSADCTDPTFSDPACIKRCSMAPMPPTESVNG